MLKGHKKYIDKEQGKTKHEAPRSVNYRATQNKNNIVTTALERVTGRPCGSVAQWSECSHGMREVLGSSPGRAMCCFLPCDIWWPIWVRARAVSSKGTVSSVPAWF